MMKKYLIYPLIFLLVLGAYLLLGQGINTSLIVIGMTFLIVLSFNIFSWKYGKNQDNEEAFIILIIVLGIIMRVGYMLYTYYRVRNHDLYEAVAETGYGHASYILTLYEKHALPSTNNIEFYQQPFFYIVCAVVLKIVNLLKSGMDAETLVDSAKIVPAFFSIITLIIVGRIMKEFEIEVTVRKYAIMLFAFCPTFYLSSVFLTPDAMSTFFIVMTLYYTARWFKEQSYTNTIVLALIYGLAVMTKISAAMMAPITVAVVIYVFINEQKKKERIKYVLQAVTFLVISLPIGLWYSVRNYLLFGQTLSYVPNPGESISTANISIFSRILMINIANVFETPYCRPFDDYNAPVYYLKCSVFGEFSYNLAYIVPILLLTSALAVSVLVTFSCVNGIIKRKGNIPYFIVSLVLIYVLIVAYAFYLKMPYGCSMDFRYIQIFILPAGLLLGYYAEKGKLGNIVKWIIGAYSIMSVVMYLLAGIPS